MILILVLTETLINLRLMIMHHRNIPAKRGDPMVERIGRIAGANAVVIFSRRSCCLCHALKWLFSNMGVNFRVYELDEYPKGKDEFEKALIRLLGGLSPVPVVFIGGKLVGGIDRVFGSHINGTLVPLLKEAGALWL